MTREEAIEELKRDIHNAKVTHHLSEHYEMAIKVLEQEPCEEHQREFIELVVEYPNPDLCTYPEYRGKPYFSIKYRENGKYIIGYGSYKIEMISQWIKEYFMPSIQPKSVECEDCISRAEAQKHINRRLWESALNNVGYECKAEDVFMDIADNRLSTWISEIPSVQPISKSVIEDIKADIAEFMAKIPALGNCKEGWHNAGQRIGPEQACEIIDNHIAERGTE